MMSMMVYITLHNRAKGSLFSVLKIYFLCVICFRWYHLMVKGIVFLYICRWPRFILTK